MQSSKVLGLKVQKTLAHLVMNQGCLNEPGLACVRLQILHGLYKDIDK